MSASISIRAELARRGLERLDVEDAERDAYFQRLEAKHIEGMSESWKPHLRHLIAYMRELEIARNKRTRDELVAILESESKPEAPTVE